MYDVFGNISISDHSVIFQYNLYSPLVGEVGGGGRGGVWRLGEGWSWGLGGCHL